MLNQLVLIGRLKENPNIENKETNLNTTKITLVVPRSYKNSYGNYDNDYIDIVLCNNIAETTSELCKKGDLVGIKGRVISKEYEENGIKKNKMEIVAEKITFLSNKSKTVKND